LSGSSSQRRSCRRRDRDRFAPWSSTQRGPRQRCRWSPRPTVSTRPERAGLLRCRPKRHPAAGAETARFRPGGLAGARPQGRGDTHRLYESHNLTAGDDHAIAVERALATVRKQGRRADPSRPPTVDDDARVEIGDKHVAHEEQAGHLPSFSRGTRADGAGVAACVRFQSSSSGQSAPNGWLLWSPSRSAVDDLPDTRDQIRSRVRGRVLLRRLEPEAAGASRGRFVAVPRRPSQL
jgi:hypothetical protein